MDYGKKAQFSFDPPTKRRQGTIIIEAKPFSNEYPAINELHKQVLDYVRDPENGFTQSKQGRSASAGVERYTKQVNQDELDKFKEQIYDLPASSSFIESGKKEIVDDYVNLLINEMERMTTKGGKRSKKRRNRKSSKRSSRRTRKRSKRTFSPI